MPKLQVQRLSQGPGKHCRITSQTYIRLQKAPAAPRQLLCFDPLRIRRGVTARVLNASSGDNSNNGRNSSYDSDIGYDSISLPANFCIIESREEVKDFADMDVRDIRDNITARRNKIFLLMEEVRRLRIQQRLKGENPTPAQEIAEQQYSSALPFLPPLTEDTLNTYYAFYAGFFALIIVFGALVAPILEVRLGMGGTSYRDFINDMHLPAQLAQVDPIVASFCGGAVGVVSALLVIEVNNVKEQQHNRCLYCQGTGYLTCGNCIGTGIEPSSRSPCSCCSSTGKVMCTGCLCTGKQMATEHDPRIDPFV